MTGEATAAIRAKALLTHAVDAGEAAQVHVDADVVATGDELDQVERAVLVALADGQSPADIAAALGLPEEMLGIAMANVLAKLHRQHAPGTAHGRARAGDPGQTANRQHRESPRRP